jgi:hypothetical protein
VARKIRRLYGRPVHALTVQDAVRKEDVAGPQNRTFSLERYGASCTMGQTWVHSLFAALELDSIHAHNIKHALIKQLALCEHIDRLLSYEFGEHGAIISLSTSGGPPRLQRFYIVEDFL